MDLIYLQKLVCCNFISYFTTEFSIPCSAKKNVCVCVCVCVYMGVSVVGGGWVKGGGAMIKRLAR